MGTAQEAADMDAILERYGPDKQYLIPLLQDVQDSAGFLSEYALGRVAKHLDMSENDVYGVATFYTQFRFTPPGKYHIRICRGTACHVRGSAAIVESVSHRLGICPGETTDDRQFSLETVACFGSCALAPVVVINDHVYGRMSLRKVERLLDELTNES